jgi:DNA-binding transcriptional ArsR family regulator
VLTVEATVVKVNQMVNLSSARVDRVFHALADSTRREMLDVLSRGDATVSELAKPFDMSLAAVSKHVKVLSAAELVRVEKRGRSSVCTLRPRALGTASKVLEHYQTFWARRLDALEVHLAKKKRKRTEQ